jgi:hypothetical protein
MMFWSWQHCLRGHTYVPYGFAVLAGDADDILKLATLFERSYLRCMWICRPWRRCRWRSEVGNTVWEVIFTLHVDLASLPEMQMTFWSWQHCLRGHTNVACGLAIFAGDADDVLELATLFESYLRCMLICRPCRRCRWRSEVGNTVERSYLRCMWICRLCRRCWWLSEVGNTVWEVILTFHMDLPSLPEMQMTFWSWQHCLRGPTYDACGFAVLAGDADDVLKLATLFERSYLRCTWTCHLCRRCRWRSGAGNTVWEVLLTLHVDLPSLPEMQMTFWLTTVGYWRAQARLVMVSVSTCLWKWQQI